MNRYGKSFADLNKSLKIEQNDAQTLSDRGEAYHMTSEYKGPHAGLNRH